MNREEITYLSVLLGSIPVGFVLKDRGPRCRQLGGAALGAALALLTCGPHALHSLGTVLGTWAILGLLPSCSGGATLVWTFGYLLFFRTPGVWGLPEPPPFANALQLLVTLKMVSLACDTQELREAGLKGVTSEETRLMIGSLRRVPSLIDILCYSYCYLGLLTGPFYRLGTHLDWVWGPPAPPALSRLLSHVHWAPLLAALGVLVSRAWPAQAVLEPRFLERPWLARLAHMVPVFLALRLRLYVGWLCAEGGCVAAGLGLYPKNARARPGQGPTVEWERPKTSSELPPDQWDFESIRTVDPWGTEVGRRFRGGLRRWNMTVQWWLAAYVHRRGPRQYPLLRNACTMLASAYWHGLHGGQHLAFLTVPLWLAAEAAAEAALGRHFGLPLEQLGGWKGSLLRGGQWFLKMRAFEYLSMGFVLREAAATLRFWASVHFCLHFVPLFILLAASAAGKMAEKGREKRREKGREKEREGEEEEEREEGGAGDARVRRRRRETREGEGDGNPKIPEGGDPLNPKIQEKGDALNSGFQEGGEPLNPKFQEGGEPLNPKFQESGDPLNPKIREGGEPLNPKFQEGGDPLNPKIQEKGDALNSGFQEGGDPLNPKFQEGGEPLNPKIPEGGGLLNPKIQEGEDSLNPKIREGGDPLNPKFQEGGDLLNPKIQEKGDALNPKFQEGGEPLNPKFQEGGEPLNPKFQEGGDPLNPKIREGGDPLNPKIQEKGDALNSGFQEGGDPLNPKFQEGEDSLNPKIREGGDPLNPKIQEKGDALNSEFQEGGDPLNPKIQEKGDALNPKIQEGGDPLNPKIQEKGDALNPKFQEGGDPLNPKIQEGGDLLNPKIQEKGDALNPKFQEGGDPLNPKIQEKGGALNSEFQEGGDPLNPKTEEREEPPAPKPQELRMDPNNQNSG